MKDLFSAGLVAVSITCAIARPAHAQLIFIPDPALRTVYNTWVPGSVNANGYLDAALSTVQTFNGNAVFDPTTSVTSVNGLEAFSSLSALEFHSSEVTEIDAWPPNLERLSFNLIEIGAWPVFPSSLRSLNLNYQMIAGPLPDISGTQLERFSLVMPHWEQDLSTFVYPATLKHLRISDGEGVTALAPFPAGLDSLVLHACFYLTAIPPLPEALRSATISEVPLAEVLTLPPGLEEFRYSDGTLPGLASLPTGLRKLVLFNCPINCLPVLPEGLELLELWLTEVQCLPNHPPNCSYTPFSLHEMDLCSMLNSACTANNPALAGNVFRDLNGNGTPDPGEPGSSYAYVTVAPIGLMGGVTASGHYDLGLPVGDYTVTCSPYPSFVQSVTPASHAVSLPTQTSADADNDFALTMPDIVDPAVSIQALPSRPGFNSLVWLHVTNQGTIAADIPVQFELGADQTFLSSTPPPATQNGNTFTWLAEDVQMGEERLFRILVETGPGVMIGTPVTHVATVPVPPGDADASNNSATLDDVVVGSYDPNDKMVAPTTIAPSEWAATELKYTVRFQNTGTWPAERVLITDTLSELLDPLSFRFLGSSHPCSWTLFNGVLRFTFDPIVLPDSTSDEPGSHGFVSFALRPAAATSVAPIGNVANIYFDHNAPIITNEALVDVVTDVPSVDRSATTVFPVPAQETLWLRRTSSATAMVRVIDAQGRTMFTRGITGELVGLDVGSLPVGAYILELRSDHLQRLPFLKR